MGRHAHGCSHSPGTQQPCLLSRHSPSRHGTQLQRLGACTCSSRWLKTSPSLQISSFSNTTWNSGPERCPVYKCCNPLELFGAEGKVMKAESFLHRSLLARPFQPHAVHQCSLFLFVCLCFHGSISEAMCFSPCTLHHGLS